MTLRVERIDHVLLHVRGMQRSLAFYRDVLGCTVLHDLPHFAMAELDAGASQIDLVDVDAAEGQWADPQRKGGKNVDHICLAVSGVDAEALRSQLEHHGVSIAEERDEGESYSIYVDDPSGNRIELKCVR